METFTDKNTVVTVYQEREIKIYFVFFTNMHSCEVDFLRLVFI